VDLPDNLVMDDDEARAFLDKLANEAGCPVVLTQHHEGCLATAEDADGCEALMKDDVCTSCGARRQSIVGVA